MDKQTFISQIAAYVIKYAAQYGIKVHSPIIAQAILESGWGQSSLAAKYHNYFGLKCGSAWTGKSVNMATSEEYTPGVHTNIRDNFRVFDSMEDGVKGYFDFINYSRYANLKGVTDPQTYVENIKADGYATSSTYVTNLMRVIRDNNLTQYDGAAQQTPSKSVDEVAQDVVNGKYGNGADRKAALEAAGYNYDEVQAKVNEILGVDTTPKKSVDEIAQEVINGAWGNGQDRKNRIERRVMITPQFRTRSMNFAEHLRNPLMKLQGQSSVVSMETVLIVRTESPQKVMIMQQYRQGSMT